MKVSTIIKEGIPKIDGLRILGKPAMSVIAFANDPITATGRKLNIYKVGEAMAKRHWGLNTLQNPGSIHICCTYVHTVPGCAQRFLADLQASVNEVLTNPGAFSEGKAALYGMAESLPDGSIVDNVAVTFLDSLTKTRK